MKTYIITPSKTNKSSDDVLDYQRIAFATASMASLRECMNIFPHLVVDDSPDESYTQNIYQHCDIIRGNNSGMLDATLKAAKIAKNRGAEVVFLHLDDMYYVKQAKDLALYATDAMSLDSELKVVHLSGFPLLDGKCLPEKGNKTYLKIKEESLAFDLVELRGKKKKKYTLWWSFFEPNMINGSYWPLALWFAFYRVDFLISLIERLVIIDPKATTLSAAESFYRRKENWGKVVSESPGKLGYINMQFGGLEMHRNVNFLNLVSMPNVEVR